MIFIVLVVWPKINVKQNHFNLWLWNNFIFMVFLLFSLSLRKLQNFNQQFIHLCSILEPNLFCIQSWLTWCTKIETKENRLAIICEVLLWDKHTWSGAMLRLKTINIHRGKWQKQRNNGLQFLNQRTGGASLESFV